MTSESSLLTKIGVGVTLVASGGVATYLFIKHSSTTQPSRDAGPLRDQIGELRNEIITLKRTLNSAVTELSKELDLLRSLLGSKRKSALGRRTSSNATLGSSTTNCSYETAWSSGEFSSDEEFTVALEGDFPQSTTPPPSFGVIGATDKLEEILSKADDLNEGTDQDKEEALKIMLKNKDLYSYSWEYLWRLSRSYVAVYDSQDTYEEKSQFASAALDYAKTALSMASDSADVHKWYAISLGASTDFMPTKEKIEAGFKLREHIDTALSIREEPTLYFMKGRWCWGVYQLTWIERKLAATLFATPPTATIEDALDAFLSGEKHTPGFYKSNQLYIAKCYYEKRDYFNAKKWLQSALELPTVNKDDREAHQSCLELIKKV